jgi:hypothetical protein
MRIVTFLSHPVNTNIGKKSCLTIFFTGEMKWVSCKDRHSDTAWTTIKMFSRQDSILYFISMS